MSQAPQAFMIYKEEVAKARLEKSRLKKEYEVKIHELSSELAILKEKMSAQEEMMKTALSYAMELEERLDEFQHVIDKNEERNGDGFH